MIIGNTNVKQTAPSLGLFLHAIKSKTRSVSILVSSDSTGNDTSEWVYLFCSWLAVNYPEYTVRYRLWATTDYSAPVSLNTGTGAFYIDIFNFALGGTNPRYMLGSKFNNACSNIIDTSVYTTSSPSIDLLIINHGHNIYNLSQPQMECVAADAIESILTIHDKCAVVVIKQNPLRDDDTAEPKHRAIANYALKRGFVIADVYSKFIALNKSSSLYADNIHPSVGLGNTGTQLFLDAVTALFVGRSNLNGFNVKSNFSNLKKNLCLNGDFSTWTTPSSPPDGWVVVGATCSQDTVNFENIVASKSLKVTTDTTADWYVEYTVPSRIMNLIKGKDITVSVRNRIDSTGVTGNSGKIRLITSSDSNIWTGAINSAECDNFMWTSLNCFVKLTDTSFKIRFYGGSLSAPAGTFINIDRVVLTIGSKLCDIQ